jgi:hypothetical protein
MTPTFPKSAALAALLCLSASAQAAPEFLGSYERRADNDPNVVARREIGLAIPHAKPVALKRKTGDFPKRVLERARKNAVAGKKVRK